MIKKASATAATVLVLVAGTWFVKQSRAATETPEYAVEKQDGDFEIRSYPQMQLATTGSKNPSQNGSFMKLFRFIDGGNQTGEKIAMTTPVLMTREEEGSTMSFIVPKGTAAAGTPSPSADDVTIESMSAMRVAAYRYSGRTNREKEEAALEKLQIWLKSEGLQADGQPLFAGYDPPWTPSFMRRNEVLIPLADLSE